MKLLSLMFTLTLLSCGPIDPNCASTCNGCCDAEGACRWGEDNSFCGFRGKSCMACSFDESCQEGVCRPD